MKSVLFLATALFGQGISLTTHDIMPEKDIQTGEFNVSLTITELLGETSAKRYESIIASDEAVKWEIFVPENYDTENPAGIEQSKIMVIRKMTHRNPKKRDFRRAIEYLDINESD